MKKFLKFVGGIASMAAVGFGAYCVYKNVIAKKEESADFDDFDDCFEEAEAEDSNREYVSINITAEEAADADETAAGSDDASEDSTLEDE